MLSDKVVDNRFLIVDSYPFLRDTLRRALITMGAGTVDTAPSAGPAMSLCKSNRYDLVLADYELGDGRNGQQLLEELRSQKILPNTAGFMILTAETTREVVLSTLEHQPDDYIAKPYPQRLLERRVRRLLKYKTQLHPLFDALDTGQYAQGIAFAREYLESGGEFRNNCQRLLGHLLLLDRQLEGARALYDTVLAETDADWALMGMARVHEGFKADELAEECLQTLIRRNYLYIDAYDYLANLFRRRGEDDQAQETLAKALRVSPLSLRRQTQYAELCELNNQFDAAADAWRDVIKLTRNSRHETPDYHLNLARNLADLCEQRGCFDDERLTTEALRQLEFMRAKYKVFDDARLSAAAIEGSVCLGRGDQAHGRDALQRADKAFQDSEGMLAAPARLEYAKALSRAGEGERAKGILQGLAKDCQHDRGMLLRIDRVMDEPVSNAGKKQIIELNRRGIAWFKENDYKRAHDAFARARGRFPRNVELNLNLLQALVKLIESSMDADEREQWLEEADDCLRLMGQVPPDHPKHVSVERIRQDLRQLR